MDGEEEDFQNVLYQELHEKSSDNNEWHFFYPQRPQQQQGGDRTQEPGRLFRTPKRMNERRDERGNAKQLVYFTGREMREMEMEMGMEETIESRGEETNP